MDLQQRKESGNDQRKRQRTEEDTQRRSEDESSASIGSFEQFSLNLVQKPILLVQDEKYYYANKAFHSFFPTFAGSNLSPLFAHKGESDAFWKEVEEVKAGFERRRIFHFENRKTGLVGFTRFNQSSVCCYFYASSFTTAFVEGSPTIPDFTNIFDLNCLEIGGQLCPDKWGILELEKTSHDFKLVYINPKWLNEDMKSLGYETLDQIRGRTIKSVFSEAGLLQQNQQAVELLYCETALLNHEVTERYFQMPAMEGFTATFACNCRFVGLSARNNPLVYILQKDITDKKNMEIEIETKRKQIADSEERCILLQTFFDESPLFMGMIELVDNDSVVKWLFWNNVALQDWKEGISGSGAEFPPKALPNLYITEFRKCEQLGGYSEWEHSIPNSNKHYKIITRQVGPSQFAYLCQDITAQKRLEEELKNNQVYLEKQVRDRTHQLEEAIQVKSRFLATMSHEIRTPLSGVIGSMNLLGETLVNQEQLDLIRITKVCGEQLLVVINDILDLSKMEENKTELDCTKYNFQTTLEESLEVNSVTAETKGLDLICDFAPNLPLEIMGDSARLRQIIVNLLSNAVKFSSKGKVVLGAKVIEEKNKIGTFQIWIRDEGIGINQAAQARIFQPFTQADSSMTRRFGGTGLGLSISKRLAELMGGTMWFESEEGKGSTFIFTIKAEVVTGSQQVELPDELQTKCIVMLVDNRTNIGLMELMKQKLLHWGFKTVDICTEGNIAALTIQRESNNVIMIINDKAIFERIEEDARKKLGIKVIYLGYSKPALAMYWPSFIFFKKPIRDSALKLALLSTVLQGPPSPSANANISTKEEKVRQQFTLTAARKKILLAEDNIMNQKVIKKILEGMGFKDIEIADDGKQAVEMAKNTKYDLVFMDIMMPEMGGIEATQLIRQSERNIAFTHRRSKTDDQATSRRLPIIALTANAYQEDKENCIRVGMDYVLTKPVRKEEMYNTLLSVWPPSVKENSF